MRCRAAATGKIPPWEGGTRLRPHHRNTRREDAPLLIQARSWHGPPEAPKNAVPALRTPRFGTLKTASFSS